MRASTKRFEAVPEIRDYIDSKRGDQRWADGTLDDLGRRLLQAWNLNGPEVLKDPARIDSLLYPADVCRPRSKSAYKHAVQEFQVWLQGRNKEV